MRAETISLDQIRETTGLEFTPWIPIGTPDEKGCLSNKQALNCFNNIRGLYIQGFEFKSTIYAFYAGKSVGKKQAVTHRIRTEYLKSQQKCKQGPFLVWEALANLGIKPRFYAAICVLEEDSNTTIEEKELSLLKAVDFLANQAYNGKRRLEDIEKIINPEPDTSVFKSLDEMYESLNKRIHFVQRTFERYTQIGEQIVAFEESKEQLQLELAELLKKKTLIKHQRMNLSELLTHVKGLFPQPS